MTTSRRSIPPREAALTEHPDGSIRETAADLRCAPSTVYRFIRAGKLKAYKLGFRTIVVGESIRDLKEQNLIEPRGGDHAA